VHKRESFDSRRRGLSALAHVNKTKSFRLRARQRLPVHYSSRYIQLPATMLGRNLIDCLIRRAQSGRRSRHGPIRFWPEVSEEGRHKTNGGLRFPNCRPPQQASKQVPRLMQATKDTSCP
jgi:hypothetical protein